jgi:hypothetical protein
MKNIIVLTVLFISSAFVSIKSSAQTGSEGFLIIKTFESIDMRLNKIIVTEKEIIVTEKGKKIEEIDLSRTNALVAAESNQILINNMLDKYKGKGYKLVVVSSGSQIIGSPTDVLMTTYVFERQ